MHNDIETFPELLPVFMEHMPPYGAYSADIIYGEKKKHNGAVEQIVLDILVSQVECHRCVYYLVMHGFAFYRPDLKVGISFCIELTERGRKFKYSGSIKEFLQIERDEKEYKALLKRRDNYLFVIAASVCVATIVSCLWDGAQLLNVFWKHHYEQKASFLILSFGIGIGIVLSPLLWGLLRKSRQ